MCGLVEGPTKSITETAFGQMISGKAGEIIRAAGQGRLKKMTEDL